MGEREIPIKSGETITVALAENNVLYLDSISFRYAEPIDRFVVDHLPSAGERIEVPMNGLWECTRSTFSAGDPVPQAIPEKLDNSIPVPGFWDQASISMP